MGDRVITVRLPQEYIEFLDRLARAGVYLSRSHAIREGVRRIIYENKRVLRC